VRERESRSNQQVEPEKLSSQKPADHKNQEEEEKRAILLDFFIRLWSFFTVRRHVSPILICNYCPLFVEQQLIYYCLFMDLCRLRNLRLHNRFGLWIFFAMAPLNHF